MYTITRYNACFVPIILWTNVPMCMFAFLTNLCYLPGGHSWVFALPSCSHNRLFITDLSAQRSGFYSKLDDVENRILDLSLWRSYILEIQLSRFIQFCISIDIQDSGHSSCCAAGNFLHKLVFMFCLNIGTKPAQFESVSLYYSR